jgi:biopolymer transport protein ExbD
MINDLQETLLHVPTGPKEPAPATIGADGQIYLNSEQGVTVQPTQEVKAFVFDREGLVRLLTECKYSNHKTVTDFLKHTGVKYL